jgi:hypothetical protein
MTGEPIPRDVALRLQLVAIRGAEPRSSFLEVRCPRGGGQVFVPVARFAAHHVGLVEPSGQRVT